MSEALIRSWIPDIEKARATLKLTAPSVDKISTGLVCAFLEVESGGRVSLNVPDEGVLTKTVTRIRKGKPKKIQVKYSYTRIMGAFQGSAYWWGGTPTAIGYSRQFLGEAPLDFAGYARRIRGNKFNQVLDFFASMLNPRLSKQHHFRPDLMAIIHSRCGGGGCVRRSNGGLLSKLSDEQYQQVIESPTTPVTGDTFGAALYAAKWIQKSRPDEQKLMYSYGLKMQRAYTRWAKLLGEPDPSSQFVLDWEAQKARAYSATIFGIEKKSYSGLPGNGFGPDSYMPFISGNFITPEELRKGIIGQVYYINEWHLGQLADGEQQQENKEKDNNGDSFNEDLIGNIVEIGLTLENAEEQKAKQLLPEVRADFEIDQRRRYLQSLVEAEFYRRRYANRSTPPTIGPFNPYPVSGFPGLIMAPDRPILGYVESVTHSIDVAGGSGTTSISMSTPRYWDEGEVWYYLGGDETNPLGRQFPQWHNRLVVPSNNEGDAFSELDTYYKFMIDTPSIPYRSNHKGIDVTESLIAEIIKDRNVPRGIEISPETLEVREYNYLIAGTDDQGYFAPGTLAYKAYGRVKPDANNHPKASLDEAAEFNERYGITERQLLEGFLGNKITVVKSKRGFSHVVCFGPTFNNVTLEDDKRHANQIQQGIMDYIDELSTRALEGGV